MRAVIIEKTFGQKCDAAVRQVLPFLTALFAALFMATQTHVPGLASVMPLLPLAFAFYWAIARPTLFGMGSAFTVGLIQDLLTGTPLGLTALALLLTRAGVATQARFFIGKGFWVYWWSFAIVAIAAAVVEWLLALVVMGVFAPFGQVILSAVLNIGVFPFLFGVCDVIERRILAEDP